MKNHSFNKHTKKGSKLKKTTIDTSLHPDNSLASQAKTGGQGQGNLSPQHLKTGPEASTSRIKALLDSLHLDDEEFLKTTNQVFELVLSRTRQEHARAQERLELIKPILLGSEEKPTRAQHRLLRKYHAAEESHGLGLIGLFDNWRDRGNRNPKLPAKSVTLMDEFLQSHLFEHRRPTRKTLYFRYREVSRDRDIPPMSFTSFCRRMQRFDKTPTSMFCEGRQ